MGYLWKYSYVYSQAAKDLPAFVSGSKRGASRVLEPEAWGRSAGKCRNLELRKLNMCRGGGGGGCCCCGRGVVVSVMMFSQRHDMSADLVVANNIHHVSHDHATVLPRL